QAMSVYQKSRSEYLSLLAALSAAGVAALAEGYLVQLADHEATAARVVDKMPLNFEHLALIALMFPRARVIHVRRHAVDTCLSGYFLRFERSMGYATHLAGLAGYYRGYRALMAHWKRVLPLPVYEMQYERLVGDAEGEVRRLVAFLGLPWAQRERVVEGRVLTPSSWQVRQPVYREAVGRWRRYEPWLGELVEGLGEELLKEGERLEREWA
ncbi:MAG: sulfotransferase, partial [Magnetococcales bacterium]|nr:sulfotransferase [Magnetococcales bacterium]